MPVSSPYSPIGKLVGPRAKPGDDGVLVGMTRFLIATKPRSSWPGLARPPTNCFNAGQTRGSPGQARGLRGVGGDDAVLDYHQTPFVMAGLGPATHELIQCRANSWVPGPSPGMTVFWWGWRGGSLLVAPWARLGVARTGGPACPNVNSRARLPVPASANGGRSSRPGPQRRGW
jgi:hypothetical protein